MFVPILKIHSSIPCQLLMALKKKNTEKLIRDCHKLKKNTLESGISVRVRLLIFEVFARGYVLIKVGYFYQFLIFKKLFMTF